MSNTMTPRQPKSETIRRALRESLRKLTPKSQWKNPVMFVVYISAIVVSLATTVHFSLFKFQIGLWLWFTVLFANFSEALAESRGKAQADFLRSMRKTTKARLMRNGAIVDVAASELRKDDFVVCEPGDIIPSDGEVVEGIASVDESAITGESAPVIRESGGDRSAVTGGTKVLSDRIIIRIISEPGKSFLDRMIALVEGRDRRKTP
ncbi:MAG: potassium-transporting ATPase subunit B, partial [Fibrobacterota bacterium]